MYNDSFTSSIKHGFMQLPAALRTILAINIAVFVFSAFMNLLGLGVINGYITQYLALPASATTLITQPWRLVTYMFVHFQGFHILFNMLWLWWMGRPVEDTLGSRNFAVLYLGAGIGGGIVHLLLSGVMGAAPTIGASGAVFGIMVCFAVLYPRQPIMLLLLPPIEARYMVAGLIFLDVLFLNAGDNIARIVHLGGALSGWLLIKAYYRGYNYDAWVGSFVRFWNNMRSTTKGPKNKNMRSVSDADFIEEIGDKEQNEMDRILDKISKEGYGSLTAEEKRILFELSKKK